MCGWKSIFAGNAVYASRTKPNAVQVLAEPWRNQQRPEGQSNYELNREPTIWGVWSSAHSELSVQILKFGAVIDNFDSIYEVGDFNFVRLLRIIRTPWLLVIFVRSSVTRRFFHDATSFA